MIRPFFISCLYRQICSGTCIAKSLWYKLNMLDWYWALVNIAIPMSVISIIYMSIWHMAYSLVIFINLSQPASIYWTGCRDKTLWDARLTCIEHINRLWHWGFKWNDIFQSSCIVPPVHRGAKPATHIVRQNWPHCFHFDQYGHTICFALNSADQRSTIIIPNYLRDVGIFCSA